MMNDKIKTDLAQKMLDDAFKAMDRTLALIDDREVDQMAITVISAMARSYIRNVYKHDVQRGQKLAQYYKDEINAEITRPSTQEKSRTTITLDDQERLIMLEMHNKALLIENAAFTHIFNERFPDENMREALRQAISEPEVLSNDSPTTKKGEDKMSDDNGKYERIPPEAFSEGVIDWENSTVTWKGHVYKDVVIPTEDLIKAFPNLDPNLLLKIRASRKP